MAVAAAPLALLWLIGSFQPAQLANVRPGGESLRVPANLTLHSGTQLTLDIHYIDQGEAIFELRSGPPGMVLETRKGDVSFRSGRGGGLRGQPMTHTSGRQFW